MKKNYNKALKKLILQALLLYHRRTDEAMKIVLFLVSCHLVVAQILAGSKTVNFRFMSLKLDSSILFGNN